MPEQESNEQLDLIPGWDGLPPNVKRCATKWKNASLAKAEASSKERAAKDSLIDLMLEEGLESVRVEIDGIEKIVRVDHVPKLKTLVYRPPSVLDD